MGNTSEIKETLEDFGLSSAESDVVLFLVERKDVSVSDLGKALNISRSSIYRYLQSLEDQGWIQYTLTNQGKHVQLADLSSLRWLIEEQKEGLKNKSESLEQIIEHADKSSKSENRELEVRYYEGRGGLRQTYWNMMKSKGLVRVYTSLVRRKIVGDKWLEYHLIEFSRLNIPVRIIGDSDYAKYAYEEYSNRMEYYGPASDLAFQFDERILEREDFKIKGEIIMYDNIVATHSTEGEKIVGSELNSEHLSTSLKSTFDVLWSLTSEKDQIDNKLK